MIEALTAAFGGLADPTRVRLLSLLAHANEICVCDLVEATGISQTNVSRHLSTLRHAGLVTSRKEGLWVYYSIKKPAQPFEKSLLKLVRDAAAESPELKRDIERLRQSSCGVSDRPVPLTAPSLGGQKLKRV